MAISKNSVIILSQTSHNIIAPNMICYIHVSSKILFKSREYMFGMNLNKDYFLKGLALFLNHEYGILTTQKSSLIAHKDIFASIVVPF